MRGSTNQLTGELQVPNLVPPQLTGLLLGGSSSGRFVHAPARPPHDPQRQHAASGPGRRVPTASGKTPSSSGGSGGSGWLGGSSNAPINIAWRAGLGGIGIGAGFGGGMVRTSCCCGGWV